MVSQAELISKVYHSFARGLISNVRDGMGPLKPWKKLFAPPGGGVSFFSKALG